MHLQVMFSNPQVFQYQYPDDLPSADQTTILVLTPPLHSLLRTIILVTDGGAVLIRQLLLIFHKKPGQGRYLQSG